MVSHRVCRAPSDEDDAAIQNPVSSVPPPSMMQPLHSHTDVVIDLTIESDNSEENTQAINIGTTTKLGKAKEISERSCSSPLAEDEIPCPLPQTPTAQGTQPGIGHTTGTGGFNSVISLPPDFGIHPGDVVTLAQLGFERTIRQMAQTYGFQERVARDVYEEGESLSQTELVLKSMCKAARSKAEEKLSNIGHTSVSESTEDSE
ncbi:hypothetical protein BU15DRAFT_61814 [Melanogaster broomeanus]|nr:hypothetical protein BU15DRAFT_61814 [Melanogaster broomeanus]